MGSLDPVTPGELLLDEFLEPLELSQYRLAKEIRVPAQRISEIVAGKRAVTADTDPRLCRSFGLSKGYRLRAQAAHDMEIAERELAPSSSESSRWSRGRGAVIRAKRRDGAECGTGPSVTNERREGGAEPDEYCVFSDPRRCTALHVVQASRYAKGGGARRPCQL